MKLSSLFLFLCTCYFGSDAQIITTIAGGGSVIGTGIPAISASIGAVNGGAFDKDGNLYVCEVIGHKVKKISTDGIITTIAGTGLSGYNGDGIQATAAKLTNPTSVAFDKTGNLYISDAGNNRIRKINITTGIITTLAGNGTSGYNGDNIPATSAQLNGMNEICTDSTGNIYIVDASNFRVRKVNPSGIITTIAGSGGFSSLGTGDGAAATAATFNFISGIALDKSENIYVGDWNAAKVRKIDKSGIISTVAGNGNYIYAGDNIIATSAQINPVRIAFDRTNHLVIADKYNRRVLRVNSNGKIYCVAGNGAIDNTGDAGPALGASIDFPSGLAYDTCGNLYIAVCSNKGRIRKVSFSPDCIPMAVAEVTETTPTIYPNPATATVTINAGVAIAHISICNAVGQQVLELHPTGGKKSVEANVPHLPAGIYVVMVNGLYAGKMVKAD